MDIFDFRERFPDEKSAIDYFICVRYKGEITCPHCGVVNNGISRRTDRPKVFNCNNCHNTFSIFKGTIFEKSDTSLVTWFYAIRSFLNAKKGFSACQLQRETGVTYKTAWRMLKQIRTAMGNDGQKTFEAIVEIDETYIGGKPRKGEDDDHKRGRGTKKTPIVGIKERSSGKVHARVAFPNKEGKRLSGKQLFDIVKSVCKSGTTVMTDDFVGYNALNRSSEYTRISVNHSIGEYSLGDGKHSNGIESFWSLLKRGIYGSYHHVSVKYMQYYVNEFCFRQGNRKNKGMFDILLTQCVVI